VRGIGERNLDLDGMAGVDGGAGDGPRHGASPFPDPSGRVERRDA
jgi:hypothetical protein